MGNRLFALLLMFAGAQFLGPAAAAANLPPMTLGLSYGIPSVGFDLAPRNNTGARLRYRPSQVNEVGLFFRYKWLGGSGFIEVPANREIRDVEGVSHYKDYHLNYYGRRIGIELNYVRYDGFLIENSSVLSDATLAGATYYRISDLIDEGVGANFIYVVKPQRYSLASGLDQSEHQPRSGGSPLWIATAKQQQFRSSRPVIPNEKQGDFGADGTIRSAGLRALAAGAGYGYNVVFHDLFLSLIGALSIGWQEVRYDVEGAERKYESEGLNAHIRLALGYHSRKFFAGTGLYFDDHGQRTETLQIDNKIWGWRLFMGWRFH